MQEKSYTAFKTIGEVSKELGIPTHVLRFWESKFKNIKPLKRKNGHRYYTLENISVLSHIKNLLQVEGLTIKGAQKILYSNKEYFCDKCVYSRPTKCFSCEKELPPQYKYLAYPTKCFSCERQELQINRFI